MDSAAVAEPRTTGSRAQPGRKIISDGGNWNLCRSLRITSRHALGSPCSWIRHDAPAMTPGRSRASSGGAAGAAGVGFQNRVFAWAAASLVAEAPLLVPLVNGTAVQVGAQTGYPVDDVAVLTDAGDVAVFQAKVDLNLGAAENSALADALQQAVDQYLNGRVPQAAASDRAIDADRDAIVLCTDPSAPSTVRLDLTRAIERTALQPPGTPLGEGLTKGQDRALTVALGHLRRMWLADGRLRPTDEELRVFFKVLRIVVLDLADGRGDQQAAVAALARTLPTAAQAEHAWTILVAEGQDASVAREWRDRPALGLALSRQRIRLEAPARYAADIDVLRERSAANLSALHAEAQLPVPGGLYISRAVAAQLVATPERDHLLIIGDAGAGKSAIAQELASARQSGEDVVVLRAGDVAGANRLVMSAPLQEVLRAWTGPPALVLIDGVDALRGSEDRDALSGTVTALERTRWQLVATARTFDTRNSRPLRRAFAGSPVAPGSAMADDGLEDVRHLLVSDLTDEDLSRAVVPPLALASVLAEASTDLRALLRNPFNLRLAAELADGLPAGLHAQLLRVRSRVELLGRYWDWRIRNQERRAREALLTRLCSNMVARRSLQATEAEPTVLGTDSDALEGLLSQDVLSAHDGPLPGVGRALTFSHNILFDYATAVYVLYDPTDPDHLIKRLEEDPSLPLVARPSFDLLVDLLWEHRDNGVFWSICLLVAGSDHVLASLAIASRISNLARDADDLHELAPAPAVPRDGSGVAPYQRVVSQLVGALRARAVLPDPTPAVLPLASLARRLASNAKSSRHDAALATDLVLALQLRSPITATQTGSTHRALAVAALFDACRTDPPRMERLAGAVSGQLQHVIAIDPEVRGAVTRLLDDEAALKQWGGTVLPWLAEAVAPVVPHDPQLARRMAKLVMTFVETRDEQVALGGSSIVRLNESRRQQAAHGAYRLGQAFPEICRADLVTAAEIVSDVFATTDSGNRESWPLASDGAVGWLEPGYGLGRPPGPPDDEYKLAAALAAGLERADPELADAAVEVLVEKLHNASAWAVVLTPQGEGSALGHVLLEALGSGALLAHPDTFPRAARLLKALVEDSSVARQQLETAVARAVALADRNGMRDVVKDVLIGCLQAGKIDDPELAGRREAMGGSPPEIPEPMTVTSWTRPWTEVDELLDRGISLDPEMELAARNLRAMLDEIGNRREASPETPTRLAVAFHRADAAFVPAESLPVELSILLLTAAAKLAGEAVTAPDSPLGFRVLEMLIDAAENPDAGSFVA